MRLLVPGVASSSPAVWKKRKKRKRKKSSSDFMQLFLVPGVASSSPAVWGRKKNFFRFYAVISSASSIPLYLKMAIPNRIHLATPNKTTKYLNTVHSYDNGQLTFLLQNKHTHLMINDRSDGCLRHLDGGHLGNVFTHVLSALKLAVTGEGPNH